MNLKIQTLVQIPLPHAERLQTAWSTLTSGQSYKHFTLVNYDSRVVIWGIFQSGMTLES